MMRSSLVGGSVAVRPATMAARAPSRLPSTAVHLPRCTGWPLHRLTVGASNLPKTATPCVTAPAFPWVDDDDDVTEITTYEVIAWSAEEAIELIKQTPPMTTHDVGNLLRKYERVLHRAEAQSVDTYAGSKMLVRCHAMAWEAYETVLPALLGFGTSMTVGEVLTECIRRGNVNNGRRDVQPRLLAAFGVRPESLPANPLERHFVAGIMYAALETRSCVRRRARLLRRVERRNQRREEEMRKREEEEEALEGDEDFFNCKRSNFCPRI
uniref:Uncharacterized protein n=1 Tax=Oryza punctata TaxID=4537 RepID=A0A0E0LDB5_ORYPU